jgi:hypothetical protein
LQKCIKTKDFISPRMNTYRKPRGRGELWLTKCPMRIFVPGEHSESVKHSDLVRERAFLFTTADRSRSDRRDLTPSGASP